MKNKPIIQAFFIYVLRIIELFSILMANLTKIYWTLICPIIMKWMLSEDSDYEKIMNKKLEKAIENYDDLRAFENR
jgi:hypothetical protein